MDQDTPKKKIVHIKSSQINWIPLTYQTRRNRDKTNEKIRELGDKFYHIKTLFEKHNINRNSMYSFGKYLENRFKNKKQNIHLQNQSKRMKDALICWYAENFYHEIFDPKESFISKLKSGNYISDISNDEIEKTENESNSIEISHSNQPKSQQSSFLNSEIFRDFEIKIENTFDFDEILDDF